MKHERVFSGIQPSASQVHIGNYYGAMKHFVDLSKRYETFMCLVDLHALTSVSDPKALIENTLSLAAAYLSIGLDLERSTIYRQSDVPEHTELCWYLACQFPLSRLELAHSLKDARAKNEQINSGRMFYPVLMAADILLFKATKVPVGADQKQHLEMTRDIAESFNRNYGELFPVPEPLIAEDTGTIPGLDGRKMSKSYDNFIGLFEEAKPLRKKVMRIVTDSKEVADVKDPASCNVFALYRLVATKEEQSALAERYRAGGMGYGEAKEALYQVLERELGPIRERYNHYRSDEKMLREILAEGARKARQIAQETIRQVRDGVGVGGYL